MADMEGKGKPICEYAKRIDPTKENLTREQLQFIRQAELAQWKKNSQKLRTRNLLTGLAIGAIVMGIFTLMFKGFAFPLLKADGETHYELYVYPIFNAGTSPDNRDSPIDLPTSADGYTFYSVSQEKIMDELDEEAKVAGRIRNARTGAN